MNFKVFFARRGIGWIWAVENQAGKCIISSPLFETEAEAREAYKPVSHIFQATEGRIMRNEFLAYTLEHGGWTTAEYTAIKWHFGQLRPFDARLMELLSIASEDERTKLREVFPHHVVGFLAWKRGELQKRLKQAEEEYERKSSTEDRQGAGLIGTVDGGA